MRSSDAGANEEFLRGISDLPDSFRLPGRPPSRYSHATEGVWITGCRERV